MSCDPTDQLLHLARWSPGLSVKCCNCCLQSIQKLSMKQAVFFILDFLLDVLQVMLGEHLVELVGNLLVGYQLLGFLIKWKFRCVDLSCKTYLMGKFSLC